ncbi:cysteine proteinase inhibitor 8-like [Lolium perenne]|jgi:hypothetical protein|uniref:cysteine proteinase inhibitor 8-like n=1 Tax=Lolium perenne TaxID=4522 RepID=UPI0021F69ACB|nr:cysteine proteinase inhibitor 8-like [Lolium perenne]
MTRMSTLLFLLVAGAAVLHAAAALDATVPDAAAAAAPSAALDGKWKPIINITDPHVQDLGRWAVVKHTWVYNDGLRFSKVVSGEMQIVDFGINYRLDVDALRMNDAHAMYKVEMFEQDWPTVTTRKLGSLVPAK